ncbi:MAG: NhaC family Na+:H+ antiporter [Bacteroidia bacterium]|jgi:NhaC family Na+:H+ antiporter|tara:strand:- start:1417 stop:2853 length:1437 start_codon:yes stop_codon:yes gene_type:complete
MSEPKLVKNKQLNIWEALIPVFALVAMLAYNVFVFQDDAISGSNQFVLLLGAAVAVIVGHFNKVSFDTMMDHVGSNLKSVSGAILILLLVGSLAAAWLVSGVIPAMIFYGIKLINPTVFLPTAVVISALISIATGSSWTTSATIGIALVAIGEAIGLPAGMVAGAVISGAYFGDKMSPLSDTTNLAAAMAGTNLFTHIKYMAYTTVPTIVITLIVFSIFSFTYDVGEVEGTEVLLEAITDKFVITPWLFLVPVIVIGLIIKKVQPLIALLVGTLLGCIAAVIFQPDIISGGISDIYKQLMTAITTGVEVETSSDKLNDLFSAGGMSGMLGTIWLIICAMVFGGVMEAIGALARISQALLSLASSVFGLFASTVASCLALNLTASDQYLAIVVPGKMFEKAYKDKGLAPENLSRTLEDSGTVTSALIPWNTCGAYQSGVLGVDVSEYFMYAIFNYLSPFMTLIFAAFKIKIAELKEVKE